MLDEIKRRRSIRRYTQEPVTDDQVRDLLEAAMAAPSAHARDPWQFVVVRDPSMRRQLAGIHQWSGMAADAPVVIVVCGDESLSPHWVEDCSAATENLLLEATHLGLGAVWVAFYGRPEREDPVRKLLAIPPPFRPLCMVPLGHPAEQRASRTRFDSAKVHYEKF